MATFRLVLDFAGVELNPARDRRVKLPRVVDEEPEPPSASDFLAILERVPRRTALPLAVIEQAAMRTQDVLALTWGDVDGRRPLQPSSSADEDASPTLDPGARVADGARGRDLPCRRPNARASGVPRTLGEDALPRRRRRLPRGRDRPLSPADLRHRRISLWHGQGIPAKEIAERSGHARLLPRNALPLRHFPLCSGRPIAASDPRRAPQHSAGWPLPHEPALALTRLTWEA
jgi:integrase